MRCTCTICLGNQGWLQILATSVQSSGVKMGPILVVQDNRMCFKPSLYNLITLQVNFILWHLHITNAHAYLLAISPCDSNTFTECDKHVGQSGGIVVDYFEEIDTTLKSIDHGQGLSSFFLWLTKCVWCIDHLIILVKSWGLITNNCTVYRPAK